jgi:protoheme IX farnesyltransferase
MSDASTSGTESPPPRLLRQVRGDLVALTKARLSILVVMTACFGYFVATKGQGTFSWATLFHLVFGTALAAAGAAVFNQLMEVEADAKMLRTSDRPLPANRWPKAGAFVLGWILAAFGLIHLGVMVNVAASLMAAATLVTYLFVYTPMKRVSTANTLVGAVSGALPPLIGWAAGTVAADWRVFLDSGAFYLFGLLFFWQLPHFAAINWMYREEYLRGGFKMWSNDDVSGAKTARIAVAYSLCLTVLAVVFPFVSDHQHTWGALAGGLLGSVMVLLAVRFLRSGKRTDARTLFFYTLLYLPLMMIAGYGAWSSAASRGA